MKIYSVKEAAYFLKCHENTIRSYISKGILKAEQPGGRKSLIIIKERDLLKIVGECK